LLVLSEIPKLSAIFLCGMPKRRNSATFWAIFWYNGIRSNGWIIILAVISEAVRIGCRRVRHFSQSEKWQRIENRDSRFECGRFSIRSIFDCSIALKMARIFAIRQFLLALASGKNCREFLERSVPNDTSTKIQIRIFPEMDIPRIFNITESAHRIHNPFTPEKLATLGVALRLESGARVLDLGSGSGEMLCTWARDYGESSAPAST